MATAQSHVSAMQKQRSELANIQSVAQLFRQRASTDAQRTAARQKVSGRWQDVSWAQLAKESDEAGWGFLSLGVKKGEMVSIIAGTRLEWTVADFGVALCGAIAVPIYASNTPEECQFILENAGAVVVVVDDHKQLAKVRQERGRLPKIHLVFLPFAHSFAQIIKAAWLGSGLTMIYAESVDKLVDNAGETGPTILSAVPRVYEKAFNTVVAGGMANPGLQGALFRMAMREFELYAKAKAKGESYSSFAFTLAKKLVFPKVKDKLSKRFGGRISKFVSGGAPLAKKIAYFFDVLGFNILEGYGLTESIAVTSVNLPGQNKLGTVGRPFPGVEVKVAQDGEILMRGRNVMRGYFGLPEATAEAIGEDQYFHTGDIGELDPDGYLKITDRKKDLIKTSGGKYIAPQAIEGALKTSSELISQVVVIGDRRKYVSVIVTVVEAEAKKLTGAASYAEATRHPLIRQKIQEAIDKVNATLPSYETIKRFTVLDRDFAQETGELTPTMKVKRKACIQKYKKEIDAMYDGESVE